MKTFYMNESQESRRQLQQGIIDLTRRFEALEDCPCLHIELVLVLPVLPESSIVRVNAADLTPGSDDIRSST